MRNPSDDAAEQWAELRQKILGLGERSVRKSHYPQLQQRLAELERFRALLDSSGDMILLVQLPSGWLADANESACHTLQYSRAQMLCRSLLDVVDPASSAWATQLLAHAAGAPAKQGPIETSLRRRDGRLLGVEMTSSALQFESAAYAIVVARDITERKRAAENLRLSEDRLRLAAEAADIGMWHRDLVQNTLVWTDKAKALFGLPPEAAVTFAAFLNAVHPGDRPQLQETVRRALAEPGRDLDMEYRVLWPDGSVRWMLSRGRVFHDETGRPLSTYGVLMDVTARKAMEMQLREAKGAAEAANRAKDEFLAVLSHELRTPLTPVLLTASHLAERPDLPQEVEADIQAIRRHVELEARIIDDLLDLTRIAKGRLQFSFQTTDLHLLVRSAAEICSQGRGAPIRLELQAQRHLVWADPGRLQQVFWNLLNNARKFTPDTGSITVRSADTADGRIRVQVSDTGAGIAPEALPKLFGAFAQAEAAPGRRCGGLGLGLAICRAIMDAHGGTIGAQSAGQGRGATFTVEMASVPADAPSPAPQVPPSAREQPSPRGLRILLVEDHDATRHLLKRLLAQHGHTVRPAASRQSAMQLAEREPFDLVVSDLGLPDGSGHELMRWLKDHRGLKGIALSGYGMAQDVQNSVEAGFSVHLTKPVTLADLEAAILRVTEEAQRAPAGMGAT